jgi:hypothetical protein
MRFRFLPIAAFRRLLTTLLVLLTAYPGVIAQITVTNATFPTAGTTLRTATATNPGIAISVITPPGGNQNWDLSGLQQGTVKTTVFKAASEGSQAANVPGAELVSTSSSSPVAEEYYNVTSASFEKQASYNFFYDVVPLYLAKYVPAIPERNAPLNFFDIRQSSSNFTAGSTCFQDELGNSSCFFLPTDFLPTLMAQLSVVLGGDYFVQFRYRVTIQRTEVVDAWGSMTIPGGTYNVLRMKRTEIISVDFDGNFLYPSNPSNPLTQWENLTDAAIQAGFQGLGEITTTSYHFINDVEKEPIAVVTLNSEQNASTNVEYKLASPLLSINNVTLSEGNSGTTNFNFTVSLSTPAPAGGVSFDITTQDGTINPATQPSDYTTKSLTSQTIPAGSSTYNFTVAVNGDVDVEPDEIFFVNVSNVTGAIVDDGQGLGTITNDDVAPVLTSVTVTTSPVGRTIIVDGNSLTAPQTFNWTPGSNHTIATNTPQNGASGTRYAFNNWSDGGAVSHTVVTPSVATIYTANFTTQHQVTTSAGAGGSMLPVSGTYYNDGTVVPVTATANVGFNFTGFSGDLTGVTNPQSLTMDGPKSVTAQFAAIPPPAPNLSINDISQVEGNSGITNFNFTVSLSAPAGPGGVTFDIATANGTTNPATQPSDYTAKSLTSQTIPAGSSTYNFTVAVNGDVDVEPDETFFVNVSNVTGATLSDGEGLGTITNDDAAVCSISSASFSNVSSCNNNGTPSNPADDFYTADLTVNFSTPPATGTLRIEPGNVNVLDVVEIAVGSLTGISHTFTGVRLRTTGAAFAVEVEYSADNACVRTVAAPAVGSCSATVCSISSASFSNISSCNNNGTPSNPADDFYTADLTVNFSNQPATGTLRIEPGNVNVLDVVEIAVGSLVGNSHTFTGVRLRTTGAIFAVEVEFSANNACVRTVAAPAVDNCAVICIPPTINAPTITQPTCAVPTGTIVVNATGSGALEYSINGGTSWSPTATFSGLSPNSYNIAVRLQSSPACLANYSSNPVVLTAATGCNTCVITCPANIVRNNTWGKCGANVTYPAATGSGNCGTLTYSKASGSFFPVGVTTVTVSSTSGASCSFTVTVKDVQKPEIKCPSDVYVSTTTCSKAITFNVTARDNCPGVTVSTVPASGTDFPVGTTTVTATATDASGNKTVSSFKVRVKESRDPVINVKSTPIVLNWPANGSYQTINVSQFVLSVADNCSNIPVSSVNIYKVTSDEAEDAHGSADGNTRKDIRIADNCKSVDLRRERRNGGNGRVYTIYVSVKDASGNTGTASFKVYAPATQGGATAVDNGTAYTVGCDCDNDWYHRSIGSSEPADLQSERTAIQIPEGFVLEQNYPNPFRSTTLIRYIISADANVDLTVFNNLGQVMAKLANGRMSAGMHQVNFDASKLAAGIYTYRLQTTDVQGKVVVINKKMILSK